MLSFQLVLLDNALATADRISDTVVVALLKEARVVLQPDGQVGAKLGHLKEVDARLAHYLLHKNVVEVFFLYHLAFFVCLVVEDVESETVTLGQDLIDQEFVLRVRMTEMNLLLPVDIDMRLVIVSISDLFLGRDKLSDVDSRGIGVPL